MNKFVLYYTVFLNQNQYDEFLECILNSVDLDVDMNDLCDGLRLLNINNAFLDSSINSGANFGQAFFQKNRPGITFIYIYIYNISICMCVCVCARLFSSVLLLCK